MGTMKSRPFIDSPVATDTSASLKGNRSPVLFTSTRIVSSAGIVVFSVAERLIWSAVAIMGVFSVTYV